MSQITEQEAADKFAAENWHGPETNNLSDRLAAAHALAAARNRLGQVEHAVAPPAPESAVTLAYKWGLPVELAQRLRVVEAQLLLVSADLATVRQELKKLQERKR